MILRHLNNNLAGSLRKIVGNVSWNVSHKVVKSVSSLIVGIIVARYLGAEQYGLLLYLMATLALIAPFATLGIAPIITRNIAENYDDYIIQLSAALIILFFGTSFTILIYIWFLSYTDGSVLVLSLATVLALSYFIDKISSVFVFYYRAIEKTKYIACTKISGTIALSSWRIIGVVYELSIFFIVIAALVESLIIITIFLFLRYKHQIILSFIGGFKNILSIELIPFNSTQELLLEKWSLESCRNVIRELKNLELKIV